MDVQSVLIVAENSFHLSLMADLLEANGLRTYRATSTREALRFAERNRPEMVVVDVALPRDGSSRFLDTMRARPGTRDIPVLAVADRRQKQEAQRVLEHCYTACVDKPISTSGFPRSVIREMRRHTTRA